MHHCQHNAAIHRRKHDQVCVTSILRTTCGSLDLCAVFSHSYLAPIVYQNTMGLSRDLSLMLGGATACTYMVASFIPLWVRHTYHFFVVQ